MESKKFYERCGLILKNIQEKRVGIKTACYKTAMPKKYMAVISSVLRKMGVLDRVLNLLDKEPKSKWTCMVLCYEILYGNHRESVSFNKKMVKQVKEAYQSLGIKETEKEIVHETTYLRLNTLKADETSISSLSLDKTIIPHVYKVLERVNWSKLKCYQNGHVFIQNLSSCMPAHVLNPPKDAVVIDACAAPGNKTTHLAMIMGGEGQIYAIEKSLERFKILREMVEKSGATNIVTINDDFLAIDRSNDRSILSATHILVDPSCTGSGIHPDEEKDYARLTNLTAFQIKALTKALKFPKVQRVVYSTCSLYEEENESVVFHALKASPEFEVEHILPDWPKRGVAGYDFADQVVRCDSDTDTQGFFLACLVRKSKHSDRSTSASK
ncbi:putative methyltransferase [Nematocida displodere]|uniref:Putative methyltransferase n=1 Tax=Nematocida displodere TaxID=1805483 RepID=A0A177EAB3_9MICR|nr:putative methyltransferase [Nematocida displodere]